jgi:hypothetical protein
MRSLALRILRQRTASKTGLTDEWSSPHHHAHHSRRSSSVAAMDRLAASEMASAGSRSDALSSSCDEEDYYESMSSSDSGSVSGSSTEDSSSQQQQQQRSLQNSHKRHHKGIRAAFPLTGRKHRPWRVPFPPIAIKKSSHAAPLDVEVYMTKREMTPTQERWNAITMLPSAIYCLYFLVTAQWLSQETIHQITSDTTPSTHWNATSSMDVVPQEWTAMQMINQWLGSEGADGCLDGSRWWHFGMPALPPLTVLAIALGICLHAPFSFLYHWTFAHRLPPTARSQHWSRRMDQSMIHVCSTCLSFAVTGSWIYLLINCLYNADCCRRQFRPIVRPKLNQMRIFVSMLAYTVPLLVRGEWDTFLHLWAVLGFSGWFFVQYPVGGWSHAVFHVLLIAVPPLLFQTATLVAVAEPQLQHAATCAALYHHEMNRALLSTM